MKGLNVIRESRRGDNSWYPMTSWIERPTPPVSEIGCFQLGWNAGLIEDMPYLVRCWSVCFETNLSVIITADKYSELQKEDITEMMINDGVFKLATGDPEIKFEIITDKQNNDFYFYNITVSDEDGIYVDDVYIQPYCYLNNLILNE